MYSDEDFEMVAGAEIGLILRRSEGTFIDCIAGSSAERTLFPECKWICFAS